MNKVHTEKNIKNIIYIGLFFSFMASVFAPLELYLSNKEYFFFEGQELLKYILVLFICLLIGVIFFFYILKLFNYKIYLYLISIFWGCTVSLYIQGNFVLTDYGVMDGSEINWADFRVQGFISVMIFVIMIMISIIFSHKLSNDTWNKIMRVTSLCIVLIQIVTLVTLLFSKGGLKKSSEYVATNKGELQFSSDENIIILILDTFDSHAFYNIINGEDSEKYKGMLTDFVYYPDTLGNFPATDLALPFLITGTQYENQSTYGDYLEDAFENSPFLNRMNNENWDCGIYTTSLVPQGDVAGTIYNFVKTKKTVSSHRRLVEYMYKLVGFRYLPQPLKKYCWFYPDDIKTNLEVAVGEDGLFDDSNRNFYERIPEMTASAPGKIFHMYHLEGTHPPFSINEEMEYTNDDLGIETEGKGVLKMVDAFLAKLKQENIYDKSSIFIMSDHGYQDLRQAPLLLVKGKGDEHGLCIKEAPVSFYDLQDAYLRVMDGEIHGDKIINVPDDAKRKRVYHFNDWDKHLNLGSYCKDIIEYETTSNAWNIDELKENGVVFKNKQDN